MRDFEKKILLEKIESMLPLNPVLKGHLLRVFRTRYYKAGDIVLNLGETNDFIAFVIKGIACAHYPDNTGHWKVARLMNEECLIGSLVSFVSQVPSKEEILALEDTMICGVSHADLYKLYDIHLGFNKVGRIFLEKYLEIAEACSLILRNESAKTRVLRFNEFHSDLVHRVPQQYIASYLGITEETLKVYSMLFETKN
jgi:CRP-like cAMP-binding protein